MKARSNARTHQVSHRRKSSRPKRLTLHGSPLSKNQQEPATSISRVKFGQMIRSRRRLNNLTQEQVARRIEASTPYVGHLESGKRHPSDDIVTRLADALGFDRRELFFLANPQAKEILNPAKPPKANSAWEEFRRDDQLR